MQVNGETCVDLWGGVANPKTETLWHRDTVVPVFSCTKAATALCAHILIDRGQLDLDAPIARYWPEFATPGKEQATVRMALDHSLGLPAVRQTLKRGACCDWDHMIAVLAAEEPFWPPGSKTGYHMITFGWIIGELVRRVSGLSLGQFFAAEIAAPLGLDFWIGLPRDILSRVARVIPPEPGPDMPDTPFVAAVQNQPHSVPHLALLNSGGFNPNRPEVLAAEIGGAGGVANARALAGMFASVSHRDGGLLSAARIAEMGRLSSWAVTDATLMIPTRFGQGFMLSMDNGNQPVGNSVVMGESAFGHVGMGGSIGFADPEYGLAFGYAMNRQGGGILLNPRGQSLVDAAYECIR